MDPLSFLWPRGARIEPQHAHIPAGTVIHSPPVRRKPRQGQEQGHRPFRLQQARPTLLPALAKGPPRVAGAEAEA